MKSDKRIWTISLIAIGAASIMLVGPNLVGMELPDLAIRILGGIDLIALAVFVFFTVKKVNSKG